MLPISRWTGLRLLVALFLFATLWLGESFAYLPRPQGEFYLATHATDNLRNQLSSRAGW